MAGVRILMQGGNAFDAAVAASAAMNVTEPMTNGIGGDMFSLNYLADSGKVTALNGSGGAPLRRQQRIVRLKAIPRCRSSGS